MNVSAGLETDVEHTRDSALLARERWQDCPLSALVGCVAVFAPNHFSFPLFRLPHFRLEHTTRVCLLPKLDTN